VTGEVPAGLHADDAELVAGVARGDIASLEELYRRHAPAVLAAAHRETGDGRAAEAVTADVFVALWDAPEKAAAQPSLPAHLADDARQRAGRVAVLTYPERQAVELALDGATYRQIARILAVPAHAAAACLEGALDKLRSAR
jgi:RNA polymerase sigma-70 factor (ECF subfamily)